MLSFFPRDVLDEIWDLIESVSKGFPAYSSICPSVISWRNLFGAHRLIILYISAKCCQSILPGRVAQSVGHLTRKSGVLGSIPSLATYFRFSFRFFKKGSCQLLAKVCARSTS